MKVKKAEFARMAGVTRQSLTRQCQSGKLVVNKKGLIDTEHPDNAYYLSLKISEGKKKAKAVSKKKKAAKQSPKTKELPEIISDINDINISNGDLEELSNASINRLHGIEKIKALKVKTQKERQELVSRLLVKKILGRIYQIDVNEFRTLGLNLAPEIAAAAGVDDNKTILKIAEIIEKEVFKVLQHVKRIVNDFLKDVGSEEIK